MDSTEDWDNEEYTGSLADTKVFTPSTNILEPPPVLEEQKPQEMSSTQSGQGVSLSLLQQEVKFYQQILDVDIFFYILTILFLYDLKELPKLSDMSTLQQQSLIQPQQQQAQQQVLGLPTMQLSQQPSAISGVLTAAQTQYLTQLTQQTSENLKAAAQTSFSSSMSSQVYICRQYCNIVTF